MKNLLSLFFILFVINTEAINSSESNSYSELVQEKYITAYTFIKGRWYEGTIYYTQKSNSYELFNYFFKDAPSIYGSGLNGKFQDNERFVKLNPNNELAIKYNFTHYVDIDGIRIFIIQ